MNHSKKLAVLTILLAGILITTTESCQKYPDGPFMSFHTRTERVAQTWKVDNYKKNGTDYTSLMAGYTETYTKDGNYSYSWGMLSGAGKWAFQNDDRNIQLTGTSNQSNYSLVILKMEQKQFWYYYIDGGDTKEFHMIQQ